MSINDTSIAKFVPPGRAVAAIRVASTSRYRDHGSGEWKDAGTLFLTCVIWGQQGENVAESLLRGGEVIVRGRLKQRSYDTRDGQRRTVVELEAEHIDPSLRNATAKVTRIQRIITSDAAAESTAAAAAPGSVPMSAGDVWSGTPISAGAAHSPSF